MPSSVKTKYVDRLERELLTRYRVDEMIEFIDGAAVAFGDPMPGDGAPSSAPAFRIHRIGVDGRVRCGLPNAGLKLRLDPRWTTPNPTHLCRLCIDVNGGGESAVVLARVTQIRAAQIQRGLMTRDKAAEIVKARQAMRAEQKSLD